MGDCTINRSYLESLSSSELFHLADRYSIDIPPDLGRIFIIEELLEAAKGEGGEGEALPLREAGLMEPVPLPRQYNITFIDVMIRDPLWAFAFWEVKSHDRELYEQSSDFTGYYLKVAPSGDRKYAQDSYEVPVGIEDNAWYLGFPPTGGRFAVTLSVNSGSAGNVLAVSRPFRLPRLINVPEKDGPSGPNPLVRLSGLEDLGILRNMERLSRTLKASQSQAGGNG